MLKIVPIVALGLMTLGIYSNGPMLTKDWSAYALLGVEAQAGPMFVGGSAKTYSVGPESSMTFNPKQVVWEVWAGLKWEGLRAEAKYMCAHPVKAFQWFYGDELFFDMNRIKLEVSYDVR